MVPAWGSHVSKNVIRVRVKRAVFGDIGFGGGGPRSFFRILREEATLRKREYVSYAYRRNTEKKGWLECNGNWAIQGHFL